MDASVAVGECMEHAGREATPCARCGTFRCQACLRGGRCPPCLAAEGFHAPLPAEAVGFGLRFLARLLDWLAQLMASWLLGSVGIAFSGVLLLKLGFLTKPAPLAGTGTLALVALVALASSVLGPAVSTWVSGTVLGKVAVGLRVVTLEGRRPSFRSALLRELGMLVDGLFFGFIAYDAIAGSDLRQRLGDRWAGTVVVRARTLSAPVAGSAGRVLAGLALGASLQGALTTATFFILIH
jgi:uncharacterized RDD family membrane protein YckC